MIFSSGSKLTEVPAHLKLVAVTKGRSIEEVNALLANPKITRIGENRLKEAQSKFPHLNKKIEKHFIGKLQSRKIPEIVELFDVIQSLENLEQAKKISKRGEEIKVMLQINISEKEGRSGCKTQEAEELIKEIQALPNINLIGVMGMASQDKTLAEKEFKVLKSLQGELEECSMGMSGDYELAIKEGSTMLRLGRILFDF